MARYERDSRNWTHARHLPAKLQIITKNINIYVTKITMKECMRGKKEMKEVYKQRKNERRIDKHTRDKQTHTHTQHTHTNLSPMAGTVPNQ
jgi:hypothetical protein